MVQARSASNEGLTIGELATRTGCTAEAVRFYERQGVLPQAVRGGEGRYRRYSDADVDRVRFLRRARDLGFALEEVRELMALREGDPAHSCDEVDAMARAHLARVEEKLAQLAAMRDELRATIDGCRGGRGVGECRILGALSGAA